MKRKDGDHLGINGARAPTEIGKTVCGIGFPQMITHIFIVLPCRSMLFVSKLTMARLAGCRRRQTLELLGGES